MQLAKLADDHDPIGPLQQFFRDNAARFADLSQHNVEVVDDIVREYEKSAGRPVQRGSGGAAIYNLFPISRTSFRTLDHGPYFPGSSLKGSIRTAWLNRCNQGQSLTADERRDRKGAARHLQERLLGYRPGKFEDDPFRLLGLSDAHSADGVLQPTRVFYAISKKKRQPREGERGSPELKVFLETVPEGLAEAFHGELRLSGTKFSWSDLCDACNAFYLPQLKSELNHSVLGALLDPQWKNLVAGLVADEIADLAAAHQGFLLRVGRHSGAESVTLDGVRDIKILGARIDGKQQFDFRPQTTEKRFASATKAGTSGLLPFGWIWVDASDDAHGHLFASLRVKLASRSRALLDGHKDRLSRLDEARARRLDERAAILERRRVAEVAAREAAEAEAARRAALDSMSPNLRRVEEFKAAFAARAAELRGRKDRLNADFHSRARKLAQDAKGPDWAPPERLAAADAIAEWLPKVVERIDKDQLKKLGLAALRAP